MEFIADNGPLILIFEILLLFFMAMYINHVYGSGGFLGVTIGWTIGGFVSMLIINIFKFEDATFETCITISICILIIPTLLTYDAMTFSKKKKEEDRIKDKIQRHQLALKEIESKTANNKKIISLIDLLSCCGGDVKELVSNDKISIQKKLSIAENNLKKEINELSIKIKNSLHDFCELLSKNN